MANSDGLKEGIKSLIDDLIEIEINSDVEFIAKVVDKWSSVIAEYLDTVNLVPAVDLSNYNDSVSEDDETEEISSVSSLGAAFLKSAVVGGLMILPGFASPIPGSFLPHLLNGIDAGHAAIVVKATADGIVAVPPTAFRPAIESTLLAYLGVIPENVDQQIQDIALVIDQYTKLGTWTLPNGVTGNWS